MLSKKLFFLVGLGSFILFLLLSKQGFGSTVDAEAYLYAAQSFQKKYSFLTPSGYYTNWTPLYPLLIAILGLDLVQYTAFLLNLLLLYQIGGQLLSKNSSFHFLFFVHNAFSVIFLMIHFFVWSEAWFLVFLLALWQIYMRASNEKKISKQSFLLMLFLANLLCLQRLAGVFFVFAFTVLIALHFSYKRAILFGLASSVGLILWFLRNSFLQSSPDFLENIFMISWQNSFTGYSKALLNSFLPSFWLSEWLSSVLLFVLIAFALFLFVKERKIAPLIWLCLCYLLIMLILRMNVAGESERYLAPIQPFVLLIFWYLAEQCSKNASLRKYLYAGLFLMMTFQMLRTAKNVKQWWQTPPNLIVKLEN